MAVDLTNKVLDIASETTRLSNQVMEALYELRDLKARRDASSIQLQNFDEAIASSGDLKHADGVAYQQAINQMDTLLTYAEANNIDDKLNAVRR